MEEMVVVEVECFQCSKKFDFYGEFWNGVYDPTDEDERQIACKPCAQKLGDYTMHYCAYCNVQFQSGARYVESCSTECGQEIDRLVDMAQEAALRREQQWLESYGEDEDEEVSV